MAAIAVDQAAGHAWSRVRPDGREPVAVEVLKRGQIAAVFRLRAAGPDGENVIAKRRGRRSWPTERTIYEHVLPALGIVEPEYYGFHAEDDGETKWLFVREVVGEHYRPSDARHRQLAAAWIARLHAAGADGGARALLPARGPAFYLEQLVEGRTALREGVANPLLSSHDLLLLDRVSLALDRVEASWARVERASAGPETVVHGDLVRKNVRVHERPSDPRIAVFDWELAGWGVPAADLAPSIGRSLTPDLDIYRTLIRDALPSVGAGDVARMAELGVLFRALSGVAWAGLDLAHEWLVDPLQNLRVYAEAIESWLEESPA